MNKILIAAIAVIVVATVYSVCVMLSKDDRRRERDARNWDKD